VVEGDRGGHGSGPVSILTQPAVYGLAESSRAQDSRRRAPSALDGRGAVVGALPPKLPLTPHSAGALARSAHTGARAHVVPVCQRSDRFNPLERHRASTPKRAPELAPATPERASAPRRAESRAVALHSGLRMGATSAAHIGRGGLRRGPTYAWVHRLATPLGVTKPSPSPAGLDRARGAL